MPNKSRCPLDSGMIVVVFISLGYLVMVFGLLFYVKNEWCDLLFKNMTVNSQNIIDLLGLRWITLSQTWLNAMEVLVV